MMQIKLNSITLCRLLILKIPSETQNFTGCKKLWVRVLVISAWKEDLNGITFVFLQIVKCSPDPCLLLAQFLREECMLFFMSSSVNSGGWI